MFIDFDLYIFPFVDKDLIRLSEYSSPTAKEVKNMGYYATSTYANRIDAMCECIESIMSNTDKIKGLGDVKPAYRNFLQTYRPNNQYYGKCLCYQIKNYNVGGDNCGIY